MVCPPPKTAEIEELFRHEVFKMLKAEGKINDTVIENMLNWPPARRAYASESITVALTFIAATPFGRRMKKALRIWRAISHAAQAPALRVRASFSQERVT